MCAYLLKVDGSLGEAHVAVAADQGEDVEPAFIFLSVCRLAPLGATRFHKKPGQVRGVPSSIK